MTYISMQEDKEPIEYFNELLEVEFVRLLGKGKFSKVLQVRRRTDGSEFALKIYNHQISKKSGGDATESEKSARSMLLSSKSATKRHALAEATILRQISHPYIVRMNQAIFDRCFQPVILLELIQGQELFQLCNSISRMPINWVVFCVGELVCVLLYLHKRHIVYRDVKLENIMIDGQGHIKLVDFGFAKRLVCDRTFTQCGTPEYMAPEIFSNKGYGTAVDMWALGVLVYELMTASNVKKTRKNGENDDDDYNTNSNSYYGDGKKTPFLTTVTGMLCTGIVKIRWPTYFDTYTIDFIGCLLCIDEQRRLTAQDATNHQWFAGLDWNMINSGNVKPPWQDYLHEFSPWNGGGNMIEV